MWRVRRNVKRLYNNLIKLVVLISGLIVAITLFNRHSTTPTFSRVLPDFSLISNIIEPILSWVKAWGGLVLAVTILIIFLMKYIPYSKRVRKVRLSGIYDIDVMTGDQFEEFLVIFFRLQGFNAKKTKKTRDHGADVILNMNGRRIVIQAKRAKGKVSNSAVQEVVASKAVYKSNEAWVVTNSYFTDPAKELAKANDVVLWDRNRLINELSKVNMKGQKPNHVA